MTRRLYLNRESCRTPLAACLASTFALVSPAVIGQVTYFVDSCDEGIVNTIGGNHGSLRWALQPTVAQDGDTIDMSEAAGCGTISLISGDLEVPQNSLTIQGPGASYLAIDATNIPGGGPQARVFTHQGAGDGTLKISGLTLTGGHNANSGKLLALGGCVYSYGSVYLSRVTVSGCSASQDQGKQALGGGVFVRGILTLRYSTIANNVAAGQSFGGGAYVGLFLKAYYSTVRDNQAVAGGLAGTGQGGGLWVSNNASLHGTTISGNSATSFGGIAAVAPAGGSFLMVNSTISGNTAGTAVGGLYTNSQGVKLYNSTIAFNSVSPSGPVNAPTTTDPAPGMRVSSAIGPVAVYMRSMLMSNNTVGALEYDFSTSGANAISFNDGSLGSVSNNLIRVTQFPHSSLPDDTLFDVCPLLGPLRDNGGLTRTHALQSGSAAIDAGNVLYGPEAAFDQRSAAIHNGTIDYPRPSGGSDPYPDIGAYEVQRADIVFNAGFDGCPS